MVLAACFVMHCCCKLEGSFLSLDCQEATAVFIHNYSFEAIAAEMVTRLAKLRCVLDQRD